MAIDEKNKSRFLLTWNKDLIKQLDTVCTELKQSRSQFLELCFCLVITDLIKNHQKKEDLN